VVGIGGGAGSAMTKRQKRFALGRYLLGLGIGIVLGVGQSLSVAARSLWWWPLAVGAFGFVVMMIGFELVARNPLDGEQSTAPQGLVSDRDETRST
jgi:hypothetical protein